MHIDPHRVLELNRAFGARAGESDAAAPDDTRLDQVEEEKFTQWMADSEKTVRARTDDGAWEEPRFGVVERIASRVLGRRSRP